MAPENFEGSLAAGALSIARRLVAAFPLGTLRFVLRLAARFGAAFRAAPFRAAPFRAALLRALVLRDAPARPRLEAFALRFAADFRPRDALCLRLPLLFFLPRGGIFLLREPGSHLFSPTGVYTRSSAMR
jgi:hypothetical protein